MADANIVSCKQTLFYWDVGSRYKVGGGAHFTVTKQAIWRHSFAHVFVNLLCFSTTKYAKPDSTMILNIARIIKSHWEAPGPLLLPPYSRNSLSTKEVTWYSSMAKNIINRKTNEQTTVEPLSNGHFETNINSSGLSPV